MDHLSTAVCHASAARASQLPFRSSRVDASRDALGWPKLHLMNLRRWCEGLPLDPHCARRVPRWHEVMHWTFRSQAPPETGLSRLECGPPRPRPEAVGGSWLSRPTLRRRKLSKLPGHATSRCHEGALEPSGALQTLYSAPKPKW